MLPSCVVWNRDSGGEGEEGGGGGGQELQLRGGLCACVCW